MTVAVSAEAVYREIVVAFGKKELRDLVDSLNQLVAVWHILPALRLGNTVVIKPSPYTLIATIRLVERCRERKLYRCADGIRFGLDQPPWHHSAEHSLWRSQIRGLWSGIRRRGSCRMHRFPGRLLLNCA
ncbi:aldehyde dehydrogenase family protein [Ruegeria marina]|uniref:aldehyde dehydrogenase family protein n=1 Tax=Ruegeria marina TaxID=639004 RepID=UPI00115FDBBE